MALSDLWTNAPEQLLAKRLYQIIAFAGEGKLRDSGTTVLEFRDFLSRVPSSLLTRYANECLTEPFTDSGHALQDVVNQVGRRLGLDVVYGRYRGTTAHIGHDGLWRLPDGHAVLVEVKTTDAYRIDLNTLADYRRRLIADSTVTEDACSMLIVVGRQDTGDLEAQIRGSRHAWDIRVISVEALLRLVALKENLEDPQIVHRIHQILIPREFTRLDAIVEVLFSTAEDLKQEDEPEEPAATTPSAIDAPAKKFTPVAFHEACVERIERHLQVKFVRLSRATFASADDRLRLVCAVSREHPRSDSRGYWFAFHPHQHEFLSAVESAYVAFGCGSPETILLVPFARFRTWLEGLNVTETEARTYWHVHVVRSGPRFTLLRKSGHHEVDLTEYFVAHGGDVA